MWCGALSWSLDFSIASGGRDELGLLLTQRGAPEMRCTEILLTRARYYCGGRVVVFLHAPIDDVLMMAFSHLNRQVRSFGLASKVHTFTLLIA